MDTNKAKGVIYGLAIGDALGRPTEFMSLSGIKADYGKRGINHLPEPALYTDDTQMSIAIAEALIRTGNRILNRSWQRLGKNSSNGATHSITAVLPAGPASQP